MSCSYCVIFACFDSVTNTTVQMSSMDNGASFSEYVVHKSHFPFPFSSSFSSPAICLLMLSQLTLEGISTYINLLRFLGLLQNLKILKMNIQQKINKKFGLERIVICSSEPKRGTACQGVRCKQGALATMGLRVATAKMIDQTTKQIENRQYQ